MHPDLRETFRDGVARIPVNHLVLVLLAMVSGRPRRLFLDEPSILEADVGTAFFVAAHPATQADHLVVGVPGGEGIVGRVKANEATAVAHVFLESGFGLLRPLAAVGEIVVVGDHHFVGGKIRFEDAHVPALGRGGGHIHLELGGAFQLLFQDRGGVLPLMIILTVDDQNLDGGGCVERRRHKQAERNRRLHGAKSITEAGGAERGPQSRRMAGWRVPSQRYSKWAEARTFKTSEGRKQAMHLPAFRRTLRYSTPFEPAARSLRASA